MEDAGYRAAANSARAQLALSRNREFEADRAAAIKGGQVAGGALDVFAQEPPLPDNPLVGLPGVVHTPHLAASTDDAQIVVVGSVSAPRSRTAPDGRATS